MVCMCSGQFSLFARFPHTWNPRGRTTHHTWTSYMCTCTSTQALTCCRLSHGRWWDIEPYIGECSIEEICSSFVRFYGVWTLQSHADTKSTRHITESLVSIRFVHWTYVARLFCLQTFERLQAPLCASSSKLSANFGNQAIPMCRTRGENRNDRVRQHISVHRLFYPQEQRLLRCGTWSNLLSWSTFFADGNGDDKHLLNVTPIPFLLQEDVPTRLVYQTINLVAVVVAYVTK